MTRCKINNEKMVIKGIDEIPMFSWNTETKEFYVLGHKFDGVNSIEDFVNYINNLQQENQKYKEVIDKAIKHVSSLSSKGRDCRIYANVKKDILDILKEVK